MPGALVRQVMAVGSRTLWVRGLLCVTGNKCSCTEHLGEPGKWSDEVAGLGRDRPLASQVWMVL